MGERVKSFHGRNLGFTLKGNKKQLSLIQSNMKKDFGSEVTVGRMFSQLNDSPRSRWLVILNSGL